MFVWGGGGEGEGEYYNVVPTGNYDVTGLRLVRHVAAAAGGVVVKECSFVAESFLQCAAVLMVCYI